MRIFTGVALAAALAGGAVAQGHDYTFDYAYPPEAARIAPLRAWLEKDKAKMRASIAEQAAEGREEARKNGYPFHEYEASKKWQVVTSTPRFLSLSGEVYSFTGGAHGSPGTVALLWDKAAQRRISSVAVFVSAAALQAAIGPAYCAKLDAERLKRRGEPTKPGDPFGECPKLGELTVLLGSSNRLKIDRIGLIADPYVAGPYAEGSYEVTLPVTPAVLGAVKPAYRATFALGH
ncbi:MAG: DUF4163 domain-containing protein [Sphingomonas bacterium]